MASSGAGAGALERRVWRAAGGAGSCAEGGGAALGAPRALAVADASADEVRRRAGALASGAASSCLAAAAPCVEQRGPHVPCSVGLDSSGAGALTQPSRRPTPQGVPADVAALWQLTGLRSVLQLPLGAPASPIGTLLLAKHEPRGFEEDE